MPKSCHNRAQGEEEEEEEKDEEVGGYCSTPP